MTMMILTHGGSETPPEQADGCQLAARRGLDAMRKGGEALDAVVAAVQSMEADGRYNAGVGSLTCMDGKTMEMDAAVMDSRGALGAVAAIRHVRHPVRVARNVARTPHVLLAGEGATAFARTLGLMAPFEPTPSAIAEFREQMQHLRTAPDEGKPADDTEGDPGRALVRRFWNYASPWQEAVDRAGHATVGAVARDASGAFAVAVSTGGSPPSLLGRVADSPLPGCGFHAGRHGAIACTGIGEHIVRQVLALTAYRWLEGGMALDEALERALGLLPDGLSFGIIGIDAHRSHLVSRSPMASAMLE
jgi:beta-aspartyl-peptidase (threonine type)